MKRGSYETMYLDDEMYARALFETARKHGAKKIVIDFGDDFDVDVSDMTTDEFISEVKDPDDYWLVCYGDKEILGQFFMVQGNHDWTTLSDHTCEDWTYKVANEASEIVESSPAYIGRHDN